MKKMLLSRKIFLGILTMLYGALVFAFIFNGSELAGLIMMAPAVLAVPKIKSDSIEDTESLAKELNKIFNTFAEETKNAIAEEYKEKGAMSIEDIDAKLKKLGLGDDTLKNINDILTSHGLEIEKSKRQSIGKVNLMNRISKAFSRDGLLDDIKKAYDSHGSLEVFKAVGNVATDNVTTDTGGNAILDMLNADEINDIQLRTPFVEEFASVSNTSKPVYTYVDYIPGEGDVDFIAEGGEKSQLDLDVSVRTESPVKAAGYEILTEEAITDIPRMDYNARTLLFKKYLLKRQDGILFGDGLNANPLGVDAIAAAFNPSSWEGDKVVSPNLYDVVVAMANQIFTTTTYTDDVEYYPNVVFINPANFASLKVTKDKNGQYLFPTITLLNGKEIDGIRIVPKNKIPAGKIMMGDFTKLNIIDYVAYSVRLGWINDQFIKNLFTMLGEGRFFTFVKNLDQRAFIYDDIDNVIAGIEEVSA
jgi:HK97 family phage major capsid protein